MIEAAAGWASLADTLAPTARLALAYAPRCTRRLWLGLLALDARLQDAARPGREPVMIQLRLAWWRDRFGMPVADWPLREPLLVALRPWDDERAALQALVDGWEAHAVGDEGNDGLALGREAAVQALARLAGIDDSTTVRRAAQGWADPRNADPRRVRLPRAMRPLMILRGLALRDVRLGTAVRPLSTLAVAVRIGVFGR